MLLNAITMQKNSNFIRLTFLLMFCVSLTQAQTDRLDNEFMLEDLRKLSHDAAEGRKTGTDGAEAARRFIVKQMKSLGAKSLVKKYRPS